MKLGSRRKDHMGPPDSRIYANQPTAHCLNYNLVEYERMDMKTLKASHITKF